MSSLNPIKFIEESLFCSTTLALSYSDPDQKWIIRNHLISLFQDYPSFKPSIDFFTHNNGTEVKLLNISGELAISRNTPPVPITIWLHELYPQMAPIVFVVNSMYPIYENHPFVDSSGFTTSSYLINWQFITKCNLLDLVRNLIKLFSLNHPFYYIESWKSSSTHVSMVSKTEAIDSLYCTIVADMTAIKSKTEEEIENFSIVRDELWERGETADILVLGLEFERRCLKGRIDELSYESDKVLNWLKVYEKGCVVSFDEIEDVFEGLDKKSEILIELKAGDNCIEDLMYALDKAVEEGVVNFGSYIKQVRLLAREQFLYRAKIARVEM
ncbi:hypothetical protein ACJIZ3_011797 [Penstemon smallii]|uniref:Protein ELC-like n=1 Tax=Penstemon smallii TaxID=265156 RepID=A0ABD3ULJ4_9LAMI